MSHEEYIRDNEEIKVGSEKGFGLVFCVVFIAVGLWPLISGGQVRVWSLAVSACFVAAGYFFPVVLRPLNILWFKFGLLLQKVMNPLIMGFLFYGTVTPIAIMMRLARKDILNLKFDARTSSYWVERKPPGPAPDTMRNQF